MHILLALAFALLPACPSEDSTLCKWNASERGNGLGRSFTALPYVLIFVEA